MGEPAFAFVDIETTGLDPKVDEVLEVALAITDADLKLLAITHPLVAPRQPVRMNRWAFEQHTKSGLLDEAEHHGALVTTVDASLFSVMAGTCGRVGLVPPMAGSSVHFDRAFLARDFPQFTNCFSYRNIDVSTIYELAKVWRPDLAVLRVEGNHRAKDDVLAAITLLRTYRDLFFSLVPKP